MKLKVVKYDVMKAQNNKGDGAIRERSLHRGGCKARRVERMDGWSCK